MSLSLSPSLQYKLILSPGSITPTVAAQKKDGKSQKSQTLAQWAGFLRYRRIFRHPEEMKKRISDLQTSNSLLKDEQGQLMAK